MASRSKRLSCPCKRLPQSLSCFTAAEYGDLPSLSRLSSTAANKIDAGGYSPLHYSAQNNHVAASSLLLRLGANVDGKSSNGDNVCGATPLHRAAYSGAVSTIRILLDWDQPQCDLLAKDASFGDQMTPLHKAAAGGRYLAVQLLLSALKSRSNQESDLLKDGLAAIDSIGRTPLAVAKFYCDTQLEEQKSVRRWDEVAGGLADWGKCVGLLTAAQTELKEERNHSKHSNGTKPAQQVVELGPLPKHLSGTAGAISSCLDCGKDGMCLTASWQISLQTALDQSVAATLQNSRKWQFTTQMPSRCMLVPVDQAVTPLMDSNVYSANTSDQDIKSNFVNQSQDSAAGQDCSRCRVRCFALCVGKGGTLICRDCAKQESRKRTNPRIKT